MHHRGAVPLSVFTPWPGAGSLVAQLVQRTAGHHLRDRFPQLSRCRSVCGWGLRSTATREGLHTNTSLRTQSGFYFTD